MIDESPRSARLARWEQIRAKGKIRFVWSRGVLGWGLPVAALYFPMDGLLNLARVAGVSTVSRQTACLSGSLPHPVSSWRRTVGPGDVDAL